ncbi:hypothetical protein ABT381_29660 [Streptomyces sp. NPDC000151]|uniref:hypothetical protein n=1 Tax=Streptomyces sp. NPDC000151 TaxID=3154244 RepID=UPI00332F1944
MTAEYEYFIKATEDKQVRRTVEGLWRRSAGTGNWEYLSLWDWDWHPVGPDQRIKEGPAPETLTPVTPERADELKQDRSRWSLHWALYRNEPRPGEQAGGVVRRKYSPESGRDEAFGRDKMWARTTSIFDFHSAGPHDPPHLVPITPDEAERIIQRVLGVSGATAL